MSNTAFGILLFVVVFGPVAYMVYDELTGRRVHIWSRTALGERWRRMTHERRSRADLGNESALSKHG